MRLIGLLSISLFNAMHHYGSHISKMKGGWLKTLEEVHKNGATAAQIFISNPMGAKMSEKTKADYKDNAPKLRDFINRNNFKLFIHSPYVLNFAKDPSKEEPYWIEALFNELQVAECIGAVGCVLHMGKAVNQSVQAASENMFNNVSTILARMRQEKMNVKLFLETSSGQGTELFATLDNSLDDLATFAKRFSSEDFTHLSFCVDTCHIFAAGYNISTKEQSNGFFECWKEKIGIQHLGVVHFNNSEKPYKSRVDRHACIQYGQIPLDGLLQFLTNSYKHGIPAILETPAGMQELPLMIAVSACSPLPQKDHIVCKGLQVIEKLILEDSEKTPKKKVQWKSKPVPV